MGATDDARAEELLARLEFEEQKEATAKVSGPPTPATGAESPGEKKQLWPETDVTEAGAGGGGGGGEGEGVQDEGCEVLEGAEVAEGENEDGGDDGADQAACDTVEAAEGGVVFKGKGKNKGRKKK